MRARTTRYLSSAVNFIPAVKQGVSTRVKSIYNGRSEETAEQPDESEEADAVNLYECSNCETTYICEELQSCPNCTGGVESVPNERDLGLISGKPE